MDQEQLETLLAEWQKRLRLQDWVINIKFDPQLLSQDRCGEVNFLSSKKRARIGILPPELIGERMSYPGVEATIIHELLHLHCSLFDSDFRVDSSELAGEEVLINLVSQALWEAKHNKTLEMT